MKYEIYFKAVKNERTGLFLGEQILGWVFPSIFGNTFYSSSLLASGNMVSFLHKTLAIESLITTTVGWFEKGGLIVEYKGGEIK